MRQWGIKGNHERDQARPEASRLQGKTIAVTNTQPYDSISVPMELVAIPDKGKKNRKSDRGLSRQNDSSSSSNLPEVCNVIHHCSRRSRSARSSLQITEVQISCRPHCSCDDTDVDTSYRMCCITVGDSRSFSAATLFDTDAHTSFVQVD